MQKITFELLIIHIKSFDLLVINIESFYLLKRGLSIFWNSTLWSFPLKKALFNYCKDHYFATTQSIFKSKTFHVFISSLNCFFESAFWNGVTQSICPIPSIRSETIRQSDFCLFLLVQIRGDEQYIFDLQLKFNKNAWHSLTYLEIIVL